jgi:hypothetical protein
MRDYRRAYFESLKEQRQELSPKASLKGPVIGAGLTALSVGVAVASVSISAPVLSVLGLAVALAGVPMTTKALVERSMNLERLKRIDAELDRIEHVNRLEIDAQGPVPKADEGSSAR